MIAAMVRFSGIVVLSFVASMGSGRPKDAIARH
jgi:hypothetical protein